MRTVLTPADWQALQEIVTHASELEEPERSAYLEKACGGQSLRRAQAESLLAALLDSGGTLLSPAVEQAASTAWEGARPARIGVYRIEEEIGRGGMGVVYRALRDDDQFSMRVAIKVVAAGLFSTAHLRRFRHERQILAGLEHPNIARLLDGGATPEGLPYVVMELVEGEPLGAWCDSRQLGLRAKLQLFVKVAQAVQYAHQKLIVHRDLKPGNIMVTQQGEPKLLDFGIAKLLDDAGPEPALTVEAGRALTVAYASPEQIRGEAVTTAADVYQLGVILFELVTGRLPFPDRVGMGWAALMESAARTPAPVPGVNPDLDRVILKALDHDPARRYTSAGALAADVQRYLEGFPVEARPASFAYVAGRFVRRHRWASAAALAFVLMLTASVVAMAVLTRRAQTEARTANEVTYFLTDLFNSNDPREGRGDQTTARELLDRGVPRLDQTLRDQPEVRARLLGAMGGIYARLGQYEPAEKLLKQAVELREKVLRVRDEELLALYTNLADNTANLGKLDESEASFREVLRLARELDGPESEATAGALANLSSVLYELGKLPEAETLNQRAYELRRKLSGPENVHTVITLNNLGTVYMQNGQYAKAEAVAREVLAIREKQQNQLDLAYAWGNLSSPLSALGRHEEAVAAARRSWEIRRKVFPQGHAQAFWGAVQLANTLAVAGYPREAETVAREGLVGMLKANGAAHPTTASAQQALAMALVGLRRAKEAMPLLHEALATRRKSLASASPVLAENMAWLAEAALAAGDLGEARHQAAQAARGYAAIFGERHHLVASARVLEAEALLESGDGAGARRWAEPALALLREQLPAGHPEIARAASVVGTPPEALAEAAATVRRVWGARAGDNRAAAAILRRLDRGGSGR